MADDAAFFTALNGILSAAKAIRDRAVIGITYIRKTDKTALDAGFKQLQAMSIPTHSFHITLTPSGIVDSNHLDGNDGTPAIPLVWAASIPASVSNTEGTPVNFNWRSLYLTEIGSPNATLSLLSGTLPNGWTLGTDGPNYSGTGQGSATIQVRATRNGVTSDSPFAQIGAVAAPVTDTTAPTVPTISLISSVTTGGGTNTITLDSSMDPLVTGVTSKGLKEYRGYKDGSGSAFATVSAASAGLSPAFTFTDIGAVGVSGSAVQNGTSWNISGCGAQIYGTADAFGFLHTTVIDNATFVLKIDAFSGVGGYSNVGIMFRKDATPGSQHVSIFLNSTGEVAVTSRGSDGGTTANLVSSIPGQGPVIYLRANRVVATNTFQLDYSRTGTSWTPITSTVIAMPSSILVGVPIGSINTTQIATATVTPTLNNISGPVFTDAGLGNGVTHTYQFDVLDLATSANVSAKSPSVSVTTPAVAGTGVKHHPGDYMLSNFICTANNLGLPGAQGQLDVVGSTAAFKGYFLQIAWALVETSFGVYSFTNIEAFRTRLAGYSTPKRWGILLDWGTLYAQSSALNDNVYFPSYLTTNTGTYGAGPSGFSGCWGTFNSSNSRWDSSAAVHRQAVMDRFIACVTAIMTQYDADPLFEGILFKENAGTAQHLRNASDFTDTAFNAQLTRLAVAACAAGPHTAVCIGNNYSVDRTTTASLMVQFTAASRAGYSGPDLWGATAETTYGKESGNTWGQNVIKARAWNGSAWIDASGPTYIGKIPIMQMIQQPELDGSQFGSIGAPFAPANICTASNLLAVTHRIWCYITTGTGNTASQISAFTANPVTNTACPSNYGSCNVS